MGVSRDGVVDEEILIVFADQKYAKRFMGAMRSAISSCDYELDPHVWVVTDLQEYPGLGQEAFAVTSWSYEFGGRAWTLAPGAGTSLWVRQGDVVVGAGRSSAHLGDPRESSDAGFVTSPRAAVDHVLAQLD